MPSQPLPFHFSVFSTKSPLHRTRILDLWELLEMETSARLWLDLRLRDGAWHTHVGPEIPAPGMPVLQLLLPADIPALYFLLLSTFLLSHLFFFLPTFFLFKSFLSFYDASS